MEAADWTVPIGDASVMTSEWIEVRSPYDGELLGRVPACGPDQVDAAVRAAKTALDSGPLPAQPDVPHSNPAEASRGG